MECVCQKNSLNRLPVPSIIRWGYMYDVIKFIFMNYRHVFIFSKAIVGKHSFNNFIKDDTSLQNNSIDDIKKPEFKSVFIALYEIVKEARSLLDNLQSNDVFIHKSFKLVQNHIEYIYNCIGNLNSYPSFFNNRCLFDYAIFCSYVEVNT